jgi:hypothetical protein
MGRNPFVTRPGWAAAFLLAIALVAAGAAGAVVAARGQGGPEEPEPLRPGALVSPNRDRLRICVQVVRVAVDQGRAREAVEAALRETAKHPSWRSGGLDVAPPVVDSGCPQEPVVLKPGVVFQGPKSLEGFDIAYWGSVVEEPSHYRLFVFIVPREELAAHVIGWEDFRTFIQGGSARPRPTRRTAPRSPLAFTSCPKRSVTRPSLGRGWRRPWAWSPSSPRHPCHPLAPCPDPGTESCAGPRAAGAVATAQGRPVPAGRAAPPPPAGGCPPLRRRPG